MPDGFDDDAIVVTTQAELDGALVAGHPTIFLEGVAGQVFTVRSHPGCVVHAIGAGIVRVFGDTVVDVHDRVHVRAFERALVRGHSAEAIVTVMGPDVRTEGCAAFFHDRITHL